MSTDNKIHHTEAPHNVLDRIIVRLGNMLSLLFLFTVAISFYEVVMRYVFDSPTIWVHESASFIGACLFVFGGIYALATNKHVRVVLIYDAVSERTRRYLNIFHHIMGFIFAALLAYAAYQMTESAIFSPFGELHFETSGSAWNPPFPAYIKIMIFLTMCVMCVQFVLHLIQEVSNLRKL
ncbi:TRAP transporter small permease subunit [Vibrio mangrovi]|uniref:TRAP transporter small permease protein n=1 Tax=Vibrio mangrovi TaxID=474394 RepID=A0A1Y6IYD9_9VIBR|nr:TRAP transporter small permease subunit [Vibrio mangrovi]MDW6005072.1 TRAP transporter small permease subunit [Vibrio mangrovi]SMS01840.1 2,3-diketo-L-gulonate TRAP transporter small permease protein YiaM [Vibrio mangrovi]